MCLSCSLQRISHLGFFSLQCFPRDVPWWSGALAQSLLLHLQFAAVMQILQYEYGDSLQASPSGACQDLDLIANNRRLSQTLKRRLQSLWKILRMCFILELCHQCLSVALWYFSDSWEMVLLKYFQKKAPLIAAIFGVKLWFIRSTLRACTSLGPQGSREVRLYAGPLQHFPSPTQSSFALT